MWLRPDVYLDRCVHAFPSQLVRCGLSPLLIGADELDDALLASAQLVVPIGGKLIDLLSAK